MFHEASYIFSAMDGSTIIGRQGSHKAINSEDIKKVVSAGLRLVKILEVAFMKHQLSLSLTHMKIIHFQAFTVRKLGFNFLATLFIHIGQKYWCWLMQVIHLQELPVHVA